MTDKELLHQMLRVEEPWSISEVNFDIKERRLDVRVECRKEVGADEQGRRLHVHGYEERRWRHLDAFRFQTIISARVPRLSYPDERDDDDGSGRSRRGRTELVPVPWAEKCSRFTALFEGLAITVLQASRSLSEGAELLGLRWDEASGIMNRALARGMERHQLSGIRLLRINQPERSADRLPQAARRVSAASQKSFSSTSSKARPAAFAPSPTSASASASSSITASSTWLPPSQLLKSRPPHFDTTENPEEP